MDPRGVALAPRHTHLDVAAVRAALRDDATLVVTRGAGAARATGPFGEVVRAPQAVAAREPRGAGDAFTAAVCAEFARAGDHGGERAEFWERALRRGHEAAGARLARR